MRISCPLVRVLARLLFLMAGREAIRVSLGVCVLVAAASGARAQSTPPAIPSSPLTVPDVVLVPETPDPLRADRRLVVQRWTTEYNDWKAWFAQWKNRREPGLFSARPRRPRPEPPPWLAAACADLLEDAGPLAEGCAAYRDWLRNDDLAELIALDIERSRADREEPRKSVWWEHVHVDALWPMTQSGSSTFGVFGMHATLDVTKRMQVFVVPGVILVRLPSRDGGRTWSAATDWGFSYRIMDFRMPFMQKASTLHLNIVRVWLLGAQPEVLQREMYLAGFSVTFKGPPSPPAR